MYGDPISFFESPTGSNLILLTGGRLVLFRTRAVIPRSREHGSSASAVSYFMSAEASHTCTNIRLGQGCGIRHCLTQMSNLSPSALVTHQCTWFSLFLNFSRNRNVLI